MSHVASVVLDFGHYVSHFMHMDSPSPEKCEIVIVGAGLAGYAAALALAGTGAEIVVLDRATDSSGGAAHPDPRTTALSPSSFKMLTCLDVLSACQEVPTPIAAMRITEASSVPKWPGGLLNFENANDGDALAYMVRNRDLLGAFAEVSKDISNISIRKGQTVTDMEQTPNGMQLTVNDHQMICDLVIACDGRQSLVRDFLGTRIIKRDYHRAALVADFSHSLPHDNLARQIFRTNGPMACLPLGKSPNGQHVSSLVWVEKTKTAKSLSSLSQERFSYALSEQLDGALGDIKVSDTPHFFPLSLMLAENYAAPHAVLLGDAAHHNARPLVFGGAVRMEGQIAVFQSSVPGYTGTACYRCVFPTMPDAKQAPGCLEAGILGPVTGLVGSLQALETIKLCLHQGSSLTGSLLLIEVGHTEFMKIATSARQDCSCCGSNSAPD